MGQNLCTGENKEQKYHGEPREKGMFKGDVDQLGRPDGKGQMLFKDGTKFVGDFDLGKPHKGKMFYPNGDTYQGEFHKCVAHGKGVWKQKNGTFEGDFEDGSFVNGTIYYSDGAKYIGQMKNNQRVGKNCQFYYSNGDKFTGEFANDIHGYGTMEKRDGVSYTGNYQNARKVGYGVYKQKGQLQYEGNFVNDQFHGKGTLRNFSKNIEYTGDFVSGKRHGRGVMIDGNGGVYEGQFQDGQKHGHGTYKLNGKTVEGQFIKGHYQHKIHQRQNALKEEQEKRSAMAMAGAQ